MYHGAPSASRPGRPHSTRSRGFGTSAASTTIGAYTTARYFVPTKSPVAHPQSAQSPRRFDFEATSPSQIALTNIAAAIRSTFAPTACSTIDGAIRNTVGAYTACVLDAPHRTAIRYAAAAPTR